MPATVSSNLFGPLPTLLTVRFTAVTPDAFTSASMDGDKPASGARSGS